ncbi:uncharacterized protein [Lolium perenne]|uniref:uncharacterized protein n=1 Tax=Lolium perenne TaxID=4522 RepID=UPI003A99D320
MAAHQLKKHGPSGFWPVEPFVYKKGDGRKSPAPRNFARINIEEPRSFAPRRTHEDDMDLDPFKIGNMQEKGATHTSRLGNTSAPLPSRTRLTRIARYWSMLLRLTPRSGILRHVESGRLLPPNLVQLNHPTMTSLPPLPEGGEVEEQAIVAEDTQGSSIPESEVAGSHKSAASHEKEVESEASESTQSLPPAVSPRNKRKRTDAEDSGTSKAEEVVPSHPKAAYDPYVESLVSSDEEEEVPVTDVAPRTSTSRTVLASDTLVEGEETSPPQQNVVTTTPPSSPLAPSPKRTRVEKIVEPAPQLGSSSTLLLDDPMIKDLLRIGSQFIGYREYANRAEAKPSSLAKGAAAPPPPPSSKPPSGPSGKKFSRKVANVTAEQLSGAFQAATAQPTGSQSLTLYAR